MKNRLALIWIFLLTLSFSFTSCSVKEEAEDVVEEMTMERPTGEIVLLKDEYKPGEQIQIAFTLKSDSIKSGSIKLAPSGAAGGNQAGREQEMNFNENVGTLTLTAPTEPGSYEITMNTMNGKENKEEEITSVSITVVEPESETKETAATMKLDKESFMPGENIVVTYTAPSTWDNSAWIGIVPSIVEHGNERENFKNNLSVRTIGGNTSGKLTFKAPEQPGVYDIRMHNSTKNGIEVEDIRIIVK